MVFFSASFLADAVSHAGNIRCALCTSSVRGVLPISCRSFLGFTNGDRLSAVDIMEGRSDITNNRTCSST